MKKTAASGLRRTQLFRRRWLVESDAEFFADHGLYPPEVFFEEFEFLLHIGQSLKEFVEGGSKFVQFFHEALLKFREPLVHSSENSYLLNGELLLNGARLSSEAFVHCLEYD